MDEATRRIEAALREKRPSSRIDSLLPLQTSGSQGPAEGLGIEHYGKVSMVIEGGGGAAEPAAKEVEPIQDAAFRIAAGSKELSLDELSSMAPPGDALRTQQLGGSRFHELSLDDLSAPSEEGKAG